MRLAGLAAALCLVASPALAWPAHLAVAASSYVGPVDAVSGASACFSVRACTSAQADGTHAALQLANSTPETCDAILNTSGVLATVANCSGATSPGTSIATFCAGSCTVPLIYDQIAGANATQPTGSDRAGYTASCQATLPCLAGGSSVGYATTVSSISQSPNGVTIAALMWRNSVSGTAFIVNFSSVLGPAFTTSGNFILNYGTSVAGFQTENVIHPLVFAVDSSGNGTASVDGVAQSLGFVGSNPLAASPWLLGQGNGPFNDNWTGYMFEIIIYPKALTSGSGTGNAHDLCLNENAYWTLGLTC